MPQLVPGSQVAGYRIEARVGRGGMGVVYRAVQVGLERVVALKVIAPELLDDEDIRARFLGEARAAASVDHPNVIPVHEAGEADGVAYIAMRFVSGSDLRSLVRRGGARDPVEAAGFVAQAGAALDAIHRAGFVHRDVKPANLLVDPGGHVYLTDFGLAKQVLRSSGATRTGHWVGTLDYVAPEQIRGERTDARADVYALGGVLHFALTGRVPFEYEGDEAKLWAQLSAPAPAPSQLRAGLRADFDAVVARAMAKDPQDRYPSAGDLGRAACAAAAGTQPSQPERVVARGAAAPGTGGEVSTRTALPGPGSNAHVPDSPPTGRRRVALVAALTVTVAGAGVGAALAFREDVPESAAPTPTAVVASPTPVPTRTTQGIGDRPNGIARVGGELWVTSSNSEWATLVSAATGTEHDAHLKLGHDIRAMVPYRDALWFARGSTREVLRVDPRTRTIVATFGIAGTPIDLAVDRQGVWVAVDRPTGPQTLQRFDAEGRLLESLDVREGIGGLVAAAGAIWVIKASTGKLARLTPGADALQDWAALPGEALGLSYGDGALWVTIPTQDAVVKVVARTGRMVTGAAGRSPAHAVVAGGRVYVASRNDHTVVVLDPRTLRPAGRPIDVPLNPFALTADERSVWVTGLGENTVTRIDYR